MHVETKVHLATVGGSPKILLASTHRWFAVARLAIALRNCGFSVEAVCPSGHPAEKTSAVLRIHSYNGLFPQASLKTAMHASRPVMVIPCDDTATRHLHSIYQNAKRERLSGSPIAALLERSLGDPAGFSIADARSSLIDLAEKEGIRVPRFEMVRNARELKSWLDLHGLPAVLKTDGSSGGVGVQLVYTLAEAMRAFAVLNAPPQVARVVKRAVVDRDTNLVVPCLLRQRPLINVQSLIQGHDATMAVACWEGKILASVCFDVVHVWENKGPASVLRWKENEEMASAASKIAEKLKLSGLYGFDFMIEEETGSAYLIEMNPRATQTCHLPLGTGHDLPAALWAALLGEPLRETRSVTDKNTVALFPQEWQRNPASPFLSTAYHDVPWEEPELVRACIVSQPAGGVFSMERLAQFYWKLPSRHLSQRRIKEPGKP